MTRRSRYTCTGIGVDDDAAGRLCQFKRQRRLAAGGRPCDKHGVVVFLKRIHVGCLSSPRWICNPADPALDSTVVDGARAILPSPGAAQWLFTKWRSTYPSAARFPSRPRHPSNREPPARGARRSADRHCGAASGLPAQEAFFGRHGCHHDRPGVASTSSPTSPASKRMSLELPSARCAAKSNRAGAARARRAVEGHAGQRGR